MSINGLIGGTTLCPLDDKARIVIKSTPRFTKMVAYKFAHNAAPQVLEDLEQSHGRPCLKATLQDLAAYVGTIVQAKEESWDVCPEKAGMFSRDQACRGKS